LSEYSELSEFSDVYSIPHFVYSIRTCVRFRVRDERMFAPCQIFTGLRELHQELHLASQGAASRGCEGAAFVRGLRSCIFEGAAPQKFDKKFQILNKFS